MARPERVSWDSDVLITILKGDDPHRTEDELRALRDTVAAVDSGRLVVVVPTSILTEVLNPLDDARTAAHFEGMLRRSNIVLQDITKEISLLAGKIRKRLSDIGQSLGTPDAQFIATALVHVCDELHTFDDRLLKLSGDEVVDGLRICKPQVEQTELGLE